MSKRLVAPFLALVTLAVPASASAHPKSATVALDYRLVLDRATRALPGVAVRILDGDRAVRITVRRGRLTVLGDLGEQMLRVDATGTWVNQASVTAQAARLTGSGTGWRRIGGSTFAWHDHRLAPPPYDGDRTGTVARFVIPATLNGNRVTLGGAFVRYRRPSPWAWLAGVAVIVASALAVTRFVPGARSPMGLALGILAGAAALTAFVTFGMADAPTGQAAWVQIGLGLAPGCGGRDRARSTPGRTPGRARGPGRCRRSGREPRLARRVSTRGDRLGASGRSEPKRLCARCRRGDRLGGDGLCGPPESRRDRSAATRVPVADRSRPPLPPDGVQRDGRRRPATRPACAARAAARASQCMSSSSPGGGW